MGSSNRSTFSKEAGFRQAGSVDDWQAPLGAVSPRTLAESDHTVAVLAQAIQHEIIPRLMLAHRTPIECDIPPAVASVQVSEEDVASFGQLILTRNEKQALEFITHMRANGAPVEAIYLDLLAPVARYLGELWENDLCDFTDVTIGLGGLQKMLRDLNSEVQQSRHPTPNGLSILLVPTPGEQHTFGLSMVAELFRKQGWEVVGGPYDLGDSPQTLVGRRSFDAVGFSLATSINLPNLTDAIAAVRKSSRNKAVCIMVGGPFFSLQPECVVHGADLVATDAQQAPSLVRLHLASGTPTQ
jgi:MerR family transcriptional regulator, light-induced transcriptional regulator